MRKVRIPDYIQRLLDRIDLLEEEIREKDDRIAELENDIEYLEEIGRVATNPYEEIGMRECDF
ncbi:MAG: hypothetical protein Q4D77_02395 [Peptostreptococcaceae bacterium]|nr:hypothetical protein [Peptostreptococcaceae bacterium]